MFEIFPIRAFSDNYMWTLVEGDQAIVVDPGEAKPIIESFDKKNLDLKSIIITHHHFDHTGGLVELKTISTVKYMVQVEVISKAYPHL